ncbi:hypothetical protein B0H63DRAFT_545392 [Podospora didyma]|uniref:Uncharacterized protein n=1 Tax=Podospora didyma TaxID=330526 RepID=A0AAE0NGM3_9PEZI|nr:hypothetical protein B0H63DRAFT_545392 [Podospora didyma]
MNSNSLVLQQNHHYLPSYSTTQLYISAAIPPQETCFTYDVKFQGQKKYFASLNQHYRECIAREQEQSPVYRAYLQTMVDKLKAEREQAKKRQRYLGIPDLVKEIQSLVGNLLRPRGWMTNSKDEVGQSVIRQAQVFLNKLRADWHRERKEDEGYDSDSIDEKKKKPQQHPRPMRPGMGMGDERAIQARIRELDAAAALHVPKHVSPNRSEREKMEYLKMPFMPDSEPEGEY